jgi:hypothetical protein
MQVGGGDDRRKGATSRLGRTWEGDVKMDHNEIGWGGVDWMCVAEDTEKRRAVLNIAMNFLISHKAETETFRALCQHNG